MSCWLIQSVCPMFSNAVTRTMASDAAQTVAKRLAFALATGWSRQNSAGSTPKPMRKSHSAQLKKPDASE